MEPTDLTIEILKGIRDEGRKTNERLDKVSDRIDNLGTELNGKLNELREDLDARLDQVSTRLERGAVGLVKNAPKDLSTVRRHLRGFGR